MARGVSGACDTEALADARRSGGTRCDSNEAPADVGCAAGILPLAFAVDRARCIDRVDAVDWDREYRCARVELNRILTAKLNEIGWKVLSPLDNERFCSAETLVAADDPAKIVADLASQKILVTEKREGFRVSTDFFNNEEDIEQLVVP